MSDFWDWINGTRADYFSILLGRLRRPSKITFTISADTNDAAPTGLTTASRMIVYDAAGGHKITGLAAGQLGDEITIEYRYDSIGTVRLTARDTNSATSNWFVMAQDVTLKPYQSITFRYGDSALNPGWFPIDDRFGTAASHDASEFAIAYTDTGIAIVLGAKAGSVIDTSTIASEVSSLCPGAYAYPTGGSTWNLWAYPAPINTGVLTLDVRKRSFGNTAPGSGDSICASAKPTMTGNGSDITATGSLSTWTGSPLVKTDMLSVAVVTNTALAKWVGIFIPMRRTL